MMRVRWPRCQQGKRRSMLFRGERQGRSVRGGGPLAASTAGEGRKEGSGRIAEEANGAIGKEEVSPAAVGAPEVEHVALVVEAAGAERVHARGAGAGRDGQQVRLLDAEDHVGRTRALLAGALVPPALLEVRAGPPLSLH